MSETLLRLYRDILAAYPGSGAAQTEDDCISRGALYFRFGFPTCACGSHSNHVVVVSPKEGGMFFVRVGSNASKDLCTEDEVVARVKHLVENY